MRTVKLPLEIVSNSYVVVSNSFGLTCQHYDCIFLQIFDGYRKNLRARQNTLPVPLKARLVRIQPLLSGQNERPCVRLEIYGCKMASVGKSILLTSFLAKSLTRDLFKPSPNEIARLCLLTWYIRSNLICDQFSLFFMISKIFGTCFRCREERYGFHSTHILY